MQSKKNCTKKAKADEIYTFFQKMETPPAKKTVQVELLRRCQGWGVIKTTCPALGWLGQGLKPVPRRIRWWRGTSHSKNGMGSSRTDCLGILLVPKWMGLFTGIILKYSFKVCREIHTKIVVKEETMKKCTPPHGLSQCKSWCTTARQRGSWAKGQAEIDGKIKTVPEKLQNEMD